MDTPSRPAPATSFKAAGSGRKVVLNSVGVPAVVCCMTQGSSEQGRALAVKVREHYPLASQVVTLNLVDLRSIPRLLRKVAENAMGGRYNETAKDVQAGKDPADYVFILPDWDGKTIKALGFDQVETAMGVAVIDRAGMVIGTHQGDGALEAVLGLLERAGA
ncbi:MAG: hypothetical protein HY875_11710 [Chloroflexi bacterium]|nr:hypothetical protein [Chloroflexota bacterium]